MTTANDSDRYIVPKGGRWAVVKEGHRRASACFLLKEDAIERGRQIVRNLGGGELRIQNEDGEFASSEMIPSRGT